MKIYPCRANAAILVSSASASASAIANAQTLPPYKTPIADKSAATPLGIADLAR